MRALEKTGVVDRRTLFTPGPATTSKRVKAAMLADWGSRDSEFVVLTEKLLAGVRRIVSATSEFAIIPIQGSGTFAIEAMIGSLVPSGGKLLVIENGFYAERMYRIAKSIGRNCSRIRSSNFEPVDPVEVEQALIADPTVTHVAFVHLETMAGLLNPTEEIAHVVARQGRKLLIDAMSTFGAYDLGIGAAPVEAIAFSSNKCLQGPPGIGFVLVRQAALRPGCSHSVVLDLEEQWRHFEQQSQWRFTPPTNVVAGTHEAVAELLDEGGPKARLERYADNQSVLLAGCLELGLAPVLDSRLLCPPILTLRSPDDPRFSFSGLYDDLARRGLYIYAGRLAGHDTFRIGCIGDIDRRDMLRLLSAMSDHWRENGISPRD